MHGYSKRIQYTLWCKRKSVEYNALKEWKLSIFNIVDKLIKIYSNNTNLLPPKPKSSFRHSKLGIQEFHRKYVFGPADKAANNIVVVCRFSLKFITDRSKAVVLMWSLLAVLVSEFRRCFTLCLFIILLVQFG